MYWLSLEGGVSSVTPCPSVGSFRSRLRDKASKAGVYWRVAGSTQREGGRDGGGTVAPESVLPNVWGLIPREKCG